VYIKGRIANMRAGSSVLAAAAAHMMLHGGTGKRRQALTMYQGLGVRQTSH
jgi:hypothetical protein